ARRRHKCLRSRSLSTPPVRGSCADWMTAEKTMSERFAPSYSTDSANCRYLKMAEIWAGNAREFVSADFVRCSTDPPRRYRRISHHSHPVFAWFGSSQDCYVCHFGLATTKPLSGYRIFKARCPTYPSRDFPRSTSMIAAEKTAE